MAQKKISELDSLLAVSGGAIIPIVAGDTTYKVGVEQLSGYTQQLIRANITGSNTFTATQTFDGAVFLNGDVNIVGNVIGGIRNEINGLEGYTASLKGQTILSSSAQITELAPLMAYTASLKGQAIVSSSQQITNLGFISSSQTINTGSLVTTSSFNLYTASQSTASLVDRLNSIESVTGSLNSYTASLKGAIEVSGQNVNVLGMITAQQFNVTYVSSSTLYQSGSTKFGDSGDDKHEFTGSVNVTGGITGSLMATNGVVSGSQQIQNYDVFALNSNLYTITGSLIGITNGLMAFTAALDNTYATDEQLLPILQATASLNTQTGSQDLVNLGISTFTGSIQSEVNGIEAYTASLKGAAIVSSSTQIPELFTLMQSTASLNTQTGSQDSVNLSISTFTGSLRSEIDLIEAYTASLKGAAIVSSSTQISNYYKFAETASANTFYGNQTISGSLNVTGSTTINGYLTVTSNIINSSTATALTLDGENVTVTGDLSVGGNDIKSNIGTTAITLNGSSVSMPGSLTVTGSLIASGSNRFIGTNIFTGSLNVSGSANLTGSVIINELTYPTSNFADGQYGVEVPTLGVNNVFTMEVPKTVYEYVKNDSGVTLPKGTPVHSTGTVGFNTLVIAASASNAATMPATFILAQDLDDEEEGLGIAIGAIQGIDTTGLTAGDAVYVGANGGFTQSKPTGSNLIQNLGIVTKVGVSGGGVVLGAGRSNDVPNIQEGYFWVGNKDSVATPIPTSSFAVTSSANIFYGNQTISGSLNVSGSTNLTGSVTVNQSRIDNGWTAYTPEWTAASVNPVINNGTIEGYYKVIGKTCFVRGNIAMGSTTTFGTGEWYVSMPFTASHADAILMTATLLDNGSGWYNATMAGARAGFNHKAPIQYQSAGGTANDINPTQPFTWASTDRFIWNGSYEIA